jgi:hypothetical protein
MNTDRRIRVEIPITLDGSNIIYYYTEKTKIPGTEAQIENQKQISEREYIRLAHERDAASVPVFKKRNYFVHESIYWMLDELEQPISDLQLIEHEFYNLTDSKVTTPEFLGLCRDVTGIISNRDIAFKNFSKLVA